MQCSRRWGFIFGLLIIYYGVQMVLKNLAMPLFARYFQRLRYDHPPASVLSKLMALKCKFLSLGSLRGISKASLLYRDSKTYWASFFSYLFISFRLQHALGYMVSLVNRTPYFPNTLCQRNGILHQEAWLRHRENPFQLYLWKEILLKTLMVCPLWTTSFSPFCSLLVATT